MLEVGLARYGRRRQPGTRRRSSTNSASGSDHHRGRRRDEDGDDDGDVDSNDGEGGRRGRRLPRQAKAGWQARGKVAAEDERWTGRETWSFTPGA